MNSVCTNESEDRFDMTKRCIRKKGPGSEVYITHIADHNCQKLLCEFPDGKGGFKRTATGAVPIDGSFPCLSGGRGVMSQ